MIGVPTDTNVRQERLLLITCMFSAFYFRRETLLAVRHGLRPTYGPMAGSSDSMVSDFGCGM